jgi:DNA-binding winged helix-turn-helix (wHTH) protein
LLRACSRARVALADGASQAAHPFASRIARLGLDRPAWFVVEERERRWILDAGEEPPARFDLIVLLDSGRVRSNGAELTLPPQRLQILERLARSGAGGISLEELHLNVWGGREYHPLRHRNAMYVALTRLRESLRAMLENDAFIEGADGRYRISSSLRVAIRSAWMASESSSHPRAASAE